jgi:hypothetical protein
MVMMTRFGGLATGLVSGLATLCLALAFGAAPASAQVANCDTYKVDTSLLNISRDAGGDTYKDALFDGDTVCVPQQQTVNGAAWGYIAQKVEANDSRTLVDGWAPMQYLQKIGPGQAAAAPPAAPAAPPVQSAPPSQAAPVPTAAMPGPPIRAEDMLRFDQPIPFGPYPLNGHALAEMIQSTPLFSPIEGVDESVWKKECKNCHQWNKDRLCQQGATYVQAPKNVLRVPHPFGGALKIALMRWAKSGCQ